MTETFNTYNSSFDTLASDIEILRNIIAEDKTIRKGKTKSSKGKYPSNMQPPKKKRKK